MAELADNRRATEDFELDLHPACEPIERALCESQERMTLALDAARMGTFDWDLVTDTAIWNEYHAKLLDYLPGHQYSYADWERRVYPVDLPRVKAAFQHAIETHTDYSVEYRVVWRDGSIHWIHRFGRFYYDNVGQPLRTVGVASDITDRKQAELAIFQSEERMSLAFDAAQMGAFDWRLADDTIVWNGYHAKLLGYPTGAGKYTYTDWERIVHPDDLARIQEAIELAKVDRTDYSEEYRVIWDDGTIHWLAGFGRFHYDSDGSVTRMTGVIFDITERQTALLETQQTAQALRESEQRYRALVEATAKIAWTMAADGTCQQEHPNWEAFTGQSYREYSDYGWLAAIHPDDRLHTQQLWSAALINLNLFEMEHRLRRYDGEYRYMSVRAVPILHADGAVREWVGIHTDITDRKQAELAIAESEERFRSTFEQAAVGIAHVSLDGRWLLFNHKLCEIVGYTRAELLESKFQDITYPADLATDLDYIRQLLAGEIQTYIMEKRYVHKSGRLVWANLTVSLRRDISGVPLHFISAIEDIHDRKQTEFALQKQAIELAKTTAQLELRNQELDRFSYVVSHDLKAPLRAISNLSTWIEDDFEGVVDPDTHKHLELMRSRIQRMEALIDGLLEYARVGNTQKSLKTFSVEDLLAEIVDSLSISDSFKLDLPTNLPPITTNRILLDRVFANTIGNAYKHHPRTDGTIRVTAQPSGDLWEFTVSDDGAGIASENHERVFDIFQTLADPQKKNTGIGLSIVKKIVEAQGGHISIESQLGAGTTFRFTWDTAATD